MQRVELEHIGDLLLMLRKGGSDCRIELALRLAAARMVVKPSDHCDLLVFGLVVWVYGSPVSEGLFSLGVVDTDASVGT